MSARTLVWMVFLLAAFMLFGCGPSTGSRRDPNAKYAESRVIGSLIVFYPNLDKTRRKLLTESVRYHLTEWERRTGANSPQGHLYLTVERKLTCHPKQPSHGGSSCFHAPTRSIVAWVGDKLEVPDLQHHLYHLAFLDGRGRLADEGHSDYRWPAWNRLGNQANVTLRLGRP